jgi:hypothetical protein
MQAAGMNPKPVRALSRNFELPGGWVQPRFRLCFPDAADVEGLMHVVLCEHLTPELIRKPEFLEHANGATGVAGLVGVIDDIDRVERVQRKLLGSGAVRRTADGLVLTLPSEQTIELITQAAFERRFGDSWPERSRTRHVLPVLRLRSSSLDATARHLDTVRIPYRRTGASLRVGPDATCGVLLQFEPES